jgi:uncharacterized protein involved in exopolysaccharide biosynthesis
MTEMRGEGPGLHGRSKEISLRELWDTAWSGKWLIIGLSVLAAALGTAYALLATPIYRADVLMLPAEGDVTGSGSSLLNQFGGLASLAGVQLPSVGGNKAEAIALMKSRAFTDAFIQENALQPVLFADEWDAQTHQWKVSSDGKHPTLRRAFKLWDTKIRSVQEDKKTGLVTLTIEWTDREQAAKWARQLVDRLNAVMRERAIEDAERSMRYLNKELEGTNIVGVQQAIYRLIEQQLKAVMLANARQEYAFKIIDPAVVPDEDQRVSPKRKIIVLLSGLAGGLLGVLIVFMRRALLQDHVSSGFNPTVLSG